MKKSITYLVFILLIIFWPGKLIGQFSVSAGSTNYTQNFNTLTNGTWENNTTLTGWYSKTDATASIITYNANTGSTTAAGLYAFGVAGTNPLTDRALGLVASNTYTGASGVGKGYIGWRLKNNTGGDITSITVTWSGEQWRKENNAAAHSLILTYQTGSTVTDLTAGSWTSASSSFTSPIVGATSATALDGNASANRTADISITITVSVLNGNEIMLRWEDLNDSGNDHFMAIDDITINATIVASSSPTLSVNPSSLTGFLYVQGSGPSSSQSYQLSGTDLEPENGDITVTGTTNYEISTDNSDFGASKIVAYTGKTLGATTIYVRLKSGLPVGTYNNENVTNAGGGAGTQNVSCNGTVYKTEPTNHITGLTGTPTYFSVKLDWTGSTGAVLPDGYLILGKTGAGVYAVVSDNSPVTNDANWSDNNFAVNVVHTVGANTYTVSGLASSTQYNFIIYPYTNSGSQINYKTNETVPEITPTTTEFTGLLLEENFIYTAGTLLTSNGWAAHSSPGSQAITVNDGGLTYAGYVSSGIGNAALVDNTGEDVNKSFAQQTSGTIYVSFLLNVTGVSAGYFTHLAKDGTTFAARIFMDVAGTGYKLGLSNTSTATYAATPVELSLNTTYLCILKYDVSTTGTCSLWVFSSGVPANETAAGTPEIIASGTGVADISLIALRQYSATQNLIIDGIRVATNWGEAPLPVELNSFTASANGNKIDLKWTTATEVNNYGFEIEKSLSSHSSSLSGHSLSEEWEKVGFVPGSGNSNSLKEYSFTDDINHSVTCPVLGGIQSPVPSWGGFSHSFRYRLKQIDNDGTFSYSNEIEVDNLQPSTFDLRQNYPNPFNPGTVISYQLPVNSKVKLELYSILGDKIATLVDKEQEAGYHNYQLSINNYQLSSGTYIYRLVAGDFVATKKMVVLK